METFNIVILKNKFNDGSSSQSNDSDGSNNLFKFNNINDAYNPSID